MKTKAPFNAKMWLKFMRDNLTRDVPDSQASTEVLSSIKEFTKAEHSPLEVWDFMMKISKSSQTEISSFTRTIFDVERFYERPAS